MCNSHAAITDIGEGLLAKVYHYRQAGRFSAGRCCRSRLAPAVAQPILEPFDFRLFPKPFEPSATRPSC